MSLRTFSDMEALKRRFEGTDVLAGASVGCTNGLELMPSVFEWEPSERVLASVDASHREWAVAQARNGLESVAKWYPDLSCSLLECFDRLPAWARVHFAIAPDTVRRTSILVEPAVRDVIGHVVSLCASLKAEHRLACDRVVSEGCWTACGDFYFAAGRSVRVIDPRTAPWVADCDFCAPCLGPAVAVDFSSPNAHSVEPVHTPFEPYTTTEVRTVCAGLEEALKAVVTVSTAAGRLITRFVRVIIPRKTSCGGSSSDRRWPGRVLLRNPDTAEQAELSSRLIHEAIHQILYAIELRGQFAKASPTGGLPVVNSPWTGRKLPVHSYLHACFVWYGLAKFWRRALGCGVFPTQAATRELLTAMAGFRNGNPIDQLLSHADEIRPDALEITASLKNRLD